jgi:UDP-N-acetylglucosamine:LPS N-acetylglucosamine transferase
MKKYKVLVASLWAGSGHNSAGDLFAQILRKDKRFEVIRFTSPKKYVDSQYNLLTKFIPSIYNFLVRYSPTLLSDAVTLYLFNLVDECVEVLRKDAPDIVIGTHFSQLQCFKIAQWVLNTHPLTLETFLDYGRKSAAEVPFNVYLRPDYSISFDNTANDWLIKKMKGDKQYFHISGHKARQEFRDVVKKYQTKENALIALKAKFSSEIYDQISSSKVSVMITSGGGGSVQRTIKLLKKIALVQKQNIDLIDKFQFFIICGSNLGFYKKVLKIRSAKLSWQNIFPFSWLNPEEYALVQFASDFPILYSIAPATMHELMETLSGPMLVHKLRGAHEQGNVDFVVNHGMGKYLNNIDELISEVFKERDLKTKDKFKKNVEKLLQEEEDRLNSFPEYLYSIIEKKKIPRIRQIYNVSFKHWIASVFLMFLILNLYNVFRFKNFLKVTGRKIKRFFNKSKSKT